MGVKLQHHHSSALNHAPVSEINVTPLVDVMLVLLIVFMVAAPLMASGVKIDLPASNARPLTESKPPVVLSIDKEGHLFLDQIEVAENALLPKLATAAGNDFEHRIYLRGDQHLPYGQVIATMGRLNDAGYTRIALVSEAPQKN